MDNFEELKRYLSIKSYLGYKKKFNIGSLILLSDDSVNLHRTLFLESEEPFISQQKLSMCFNQFIIYLYKNSKDYKSNPNLDITKIIKPHEFLGISEEEFNKLESFLLNIDFPKQSIMLEFREKFNGSYEINLSENYYIALSAMFTLSDKQTAELERKRNDIELDICKVLYEEIEEKDVLYAKDKNDKMYDTIIYRIDKYDKKNKIMTGKAYLAEYKRYMLKCNWGLDIKNCIKMIF